MTSNLQLILDSVRAAVTSENWLAALALTLTLPDICSSIEDPDQKCRYSKWWDNNCRASYRDGDGEKDCVTGVEVFLLRCAYLHEGSDSSDPKQVQKYEATVDRFNFVLSNDSSSHLKIDGTRVLLDARTFCLDMCLRVEEWEQTVLGEDSNMQERASRLLKIYALAPFSAKITLSGTTNPRYMRNAQNAARHSLKRNTKLFAAIVAN
jgi:hypothetical protein